jgi:sorting nexin-14
MVCQTTIQPSFLDNLNNELLDPKITTDPSKLSSLHQQSEKLLSLFHQNLHDEKDRAIESLSDALENVKGNLQGKWKKAFFHTSNYFYLIYGGREIQDINVLK